MRLDPSYLNYITRQELRVLVAIQMGMKNHQYVPSRLIHGIANLKTGDTYKVIKQLLKLKFICHVSKKYDGYKLNYLGYDYLALQTFMKRGSIKTVVCKIGVGKQSDIYKCIDSHGQQVVLKFARLGRTSFRTIKNNRDYIKNRTGYNWLYLSRLSTIKQYTFMEILYKNKFPTPIPIDSNRHGIVMSLIDGVPIHHVKEMGDCEQAFKTCLNLIRKFAQHGLIHGDFNQFNLMINEQNQITVIDFPQCVSTNHLNAQYYFNRDVECIYLFFEKLKQKSMTHEKNKVFQLQNYDMPNVKEITIIKNLDNEVRASGYYDKRNFTQIDLKNYEQYQEFNRKLKRGEDYVIQQDYDSEQQDQFFAEIQNIEEIKQPQEQEQAIKDLVKEMEKNFEELEPIQKKQGEQDQEEQIEQDQCEERFKGMTDYQIRQILKQQKQQQKIKKKQEEKNMEDLIKRIARKKQKVHKRVTYNKNKGVNKVHPDDIFS